MEDGEKKRKEKEIHSVLLCQVPSCLISGPSMESVPSVCVRVLKYCTERDVLCDCVCVLCDCVRVGFCDQLSFIVSPFQ